MAGYELTYRWAVVYFWTSCRRSDALVLGQVVVEGVMHGVPAKVKELWPLHDQPPRRSIRGGPRRPPHIDVVVLHWDDLQQPYVWRQVSRPTSCPASPLTCGDNVESSTATNMDAGTATTITARPAEHPEATPGVAVAAATADRRRVVRSGIRSDRMINLRRGVLTGGK
jgi:hypothetical protein